MRMRARGACFPGWPDVVLGCASQSRKGATQPRRLAVCIPSPCRLGPQHSSKGPAQCCRLTSPAATQGGQERADLQHLPQHSALSASLAPACLLVLTPSGGQGLSRAVGGLPGSCRASPGSGWSGRRPPTPAACACCSSQTFRGRGLSLGCCWTCRSPSNHCQSQTGCSAALAGCQIELGVAFGVLRQHLARDAASTLHPPGICCAAPR